jgi:hypothetical protein
LIHRTTDPLHIPGLILKLYSTNKTDCHNIAEILLKVVLNTIKQLNKHHILEWYNRPWAHFWLWLSRLELATSVVIGTDCIGSCKSNYHTITATMAPKIWQLQYYKLAALGSIYVRSSIKIAHFVPIRWQTWLP